MHFNQLKRREFITLLAGAALIGPPTAIAQKPKVYRLGTLTAGPPMSPASGDGAVLIGALTQRGYTLGQNLTYEARGAAGKLSQMPQQMQELKRANVDVARGLALLFGIGTKALPSWDSKMRWNNLSGGLAVG